MLSSFPFFDEVLCVHYCNMDKNIVHCLLQHMQELLWYARFGLWWVILGVASSIGLGIAQSSIVFV